MNKKIVWTAIIVVGVLALIFVVAFTRNSDPNSKKQGTTNEENVRLLSTDFNLKDYDGNQVDLASFIGKPLVINSWAAWCPFCVEELKDFAEIQRELGDSVIIIAIDRAESKSIAKRFSDELGVTDDLVFLLDSRDAFYKSIGGFTMPETIFVNTKGEIVIHKRGFMKATEIKDKISQIQ